MLEFRKTMDDRAMDVYRCEPHAKQQHIGSIQWHPDKVPRFVWCVGTALEVTLGEMKEIIEAFKTYR
jgi:hypothetical protein